MMKDWFLVTASSSKPYFRSMAVRKEETSDGVGEESCVSRDGVGEVGAGTGTGDGDLCGGSLNWVR